ncbi:hypothetical protein [Mesorhizobium sp. M6A.T.Ce.TU.016.01.1.1]|uniref:hypothetical protein n=1 Tax=Mesorhizobium sp. M6A.T.Ce.TU.016.01.1.1 TaxID=2496783 RepID=UPI000FCC81E1|nr:hypothetical protein [Mesorhizobium sp. M6A.T.Ce.TU.016.01.1.1]RUU25957.1 hypothetical protein EOC94_29460 [Mesorhizobium sp. M6A.T.Ce.TU.016.01.1.1]
MIDRDGEHLTRMDTTRSSDTGGPIGVLDLWDGRPPHSIPETLYGRPVISEKVPGAWWQALLDDDPRLYTAYTEAACRLVDRGAVAISSGCGYTVRYQEAVATAVNVPVATGSLLLAPMVIRHLARKAKLGVVVAHEKYVETDLLGIVCDPADRERVVVGGISRSMLVASELKRPPGTAPIPDSDTERHLIDTVRQLRAAHPDIGAFIFECTALPQFAPKLRRMTGLPIYDHDTARRLVLEAIT